jgi:hypothetical protein
VVWRICDTRGLQFVRRKRLDLSIHREEDVLRVERIVAGLLDSGLSVYVDVGVLDNSLGNKANCRDVLRKHEGRLVAWMRRLGVSYSTYYTCLVTTGDGASTLVRASRLTNEFGIRAYTADPGEEIAYSWEPTDFWDAGKPRPEEHGAVFLAKTIDDGTALDVRVSDALRPVLFAPTQLREPSEDERRLLRVLLSRCSECSSNWLANLLVSPMQDGGMGSLRLRLREDETAAGSFGKRVAELRFADIDGVQVIASLNLDSLGMPYELDIWKTDFSPLVRIPHDLDSQSEP